MSDLKTIKFLAAAFTFLVVPFQVQAQIPNPLDQFRTNSNEQQAQPQQQSQPRNPDDIPPPTIGGMQQQGLTQEQINQALAGYNLDGGMTLEERQAEAEAQARESAFEAMMNGAFPLKPEEIREVLEVFREVREASESRIGGAPNPEITLESVPLDPGSTPPIIQLSPNYVTTLNVLDITGQPWPIQDISWGGNFEILQPEDGANIVRISPLRAHEVGNLSVRLVDLNTPVIFSLQSDLGDVDVRFDAQIPEYGPNAEMPLIDNGGIQTTAGDNEIIRILDGVPPSQAEKLDVDGVDGRTSVYEVDGRIYVRTPHTLLSPGWSGTIKSADGTSVYAINQSPVLLLSDRGKMVRAFVNYN
jgi:intracellular multiplication protein IcmK